MATCQACGLEPKEKPKVFCPGCGAMMGTFKPSAATRGPKTTKKSTTAKKAAPAKKTAKKAATKKGAKK